LGIEPKALLDKGTEEYLVYSAVLNKASRLHVENKLEEIKLTAQLVGLEVAKVIANIF